jgi:uncharacterized protein (TIGR00299 family) protein
VSGRHAWVDASAGVAGDMLLGALVDAGADLEVAQQAIDAVLPGAVRLSRSTVQRAGQRATKVDVELLATDSPHRDWASIQGLIDAADLAAPVRDGVWRTFAALAAAEAHIHGVPVTDVHFHEVGALDSIADIVVVCAALASLEVATLSAGVVAVGAGRIRTAHGDLAVPVPAVVRLAQGWTVAAGGQGELTTPTGMALLTTLAQRCEPLPAMTLSAAGSGAGSRDTPDRANITRVLVGERTDASSDGPTGEPATILAANVDDLDPRLWPGVLSRLLEAGAADAWLTPITMKKGRPAHTLTLLCDPDDAALLSRLMLSHTSTIGVRRHEVSRDVLARGWVDVAVGPDTVGVKVAHRDRLVWRATPEFAEVAALAAHRNQPENDVLSAVQAAAVAAGLTPGSPLPPDLRTDQHRAQPTGEPAG